MTKFDREAAKWWRQQIDGSRGVGRDNGDLRTMAFAVAIESIQRQLVFLRLRNTRQRKPSTNGRTRRVVPL